MERALPSAAGCWLVASSSASSAGCLTRAHAASSSCANASACTGYAGQKRHRSVSARSWRVKSRATAAQAASARLLPHRAPACDSLPATLPPAQRCGPANNASCARLCLASSMGQRACFYTCRCFPDVATTNDTGKQCWHSPDCTPLPAAPRAGSCGGAARRKPDSAQ